MSLLDTPMSTVERNKNKWRCLIDHLLSARPILGASNGRNDTQQIWDWDFWMAAFYSWLGVLKLQAGWAEVQALKEEFSPQLHPYR